MPSTVIDRFSYDTDRNILTIVFLSGNVYEYKDVPEKVYKHMKSSLSRGRFFNHAIKDKYTFERLDDED